MRWSDFTHAVRAAAGILAEREVVVIGSQAITVLDDPDGTKSGILSGAIGEWSPFHESFGFYVDGVSMSTPAAPRGWQSRLVRVETPAMNGAAALAMEPHDLCVAKLFAHREKDLTFGGRSSLSYVGSEN